MRISKKLLKELYFNGGIELIILAADLALALPAGVCELAHFESMANIFSMIFLFSSIIVCFPVLVACMLRDKTSVFSMRKSLGGKFIINQSVSVKQLQKSCPALEFSNAIKNDVKILPEGTYLCYTHEAVINHLIREAARAGRKIEITRMIPLGHSRLIIVKHQLRRCSKCKNCNHKKACPIKIRNSKKVQMYGVEFKVY